MALVVPETDVIEEPEGGTRGCLWIAALTALWMEASAPYLGMELPGRGGGKLLLEVTGTSDDNPGVALKGSGMNYLICMGPANSPAVT